MEDEQRHPASLALASYGGRSDIDVVRDVKQALVANEAVEIENLQVVADRGFVTLTGTADSPVEGDLAERAARRVRGVRNVFNRIHVVALTPRSDMEIREEVMRRLQNDPRVPSRNVQVAVVNGVVRLYGVVSSQVAWQHARRAAWVRGVVRVDDATLSISPRALPDASFGNESTWRRRP